MSRARETVTLPALLIGLPFGLFMVWTEAGLRRSVLDRQPPSLWRFSE